MELKDQLNILTNPQLITLHNELILYINNLKQNKPEENQQYKNINPFLKETGITKKRISILETLKILAETIKENNIQDIKLTGLIYLSTEDINHLYRITDGLSTAEFKAALENNLNVTPGTNLNNVFKSYKLIKEFKTIGQYNKYRYGNKYIIKFLNQVKNNNINITMINQKVQEYINKYDPILKADYYTLLKQGHITITPEPATTAEHNILLTPNLYLNIGGY